MSKLAIVASTSKETSPVMFKAMDPEHNNLDIQLFRDRPELLNTLNQLKSKFIARTGIEPSFYIVSPGRVNLIGGLLVRNYVDL